MLIRTRSFRLIRSPRPLLGAALGALAIALSVGCASNRPGAVSAGPMIETAQSSSGSIVDHDAYAQLGYRLVWQGYPVMGDRAAVRFFDVFDDVIVMHSAANVITLMETTTGSNRWVREVGTRLDAFVGNTTDNGQLLVSSDNELFMLDMRTGEITDKDNLAVVVSTPPRVVWPIVVYGSGGGEVLGHNLETGFKLWGYKLRGSITARPVRIGERLVGVVSQEGDVIILDAWNGSSTLRARIFGGLENNPVGSDDAMYVASLDQSIYGFATRGDTWDWRVRTQNPLRAQPTLLDGVLYVDIPGEGLAAIDPAYGGERIWTNPDAAGAVIGMQDGDLIVFNRERRTAYRIDPERGDLIETVVLQGVERLHMSPNIDGDLFAVSPRGVVSKFTPRF